MALTVLLNAPTFVAIDKPPGQLVVPAREGGPTLRDELEAQLGEKLFVVHRLDRDTSGVLLFARTAAAHRALSMAFEAGRIEKRYFALVEGSWTQSIVVDVPLEPGRKGGSRPARLGRSGKPATTAFRPQLLFENVTWLEARPLTGRTHQIRVHARSAGHPLVVDPLYGSPGPFVVGGVALVRTPLHAGVLAIPALPEGGVAETEILAPVPPDLSRIVQALSSTSIR